MALENGEVLQNLTNQLQEVTQQLNTLTETRVKLIGAIEVLSQIEEENNPAPVAEAPPVEEAPAEEAPAEEASE
jgi:small-conductance mechanosensitive channel